MSSAHLNAAPVSCGGNFRHSVGKFPRSSVNAAPPSAGNFPHSAGNVPRSAGNFPRTSPGLGLEADWRCYHGRVAKWSVA